MDGRRPMFQILGWVAFDPTAPLCPDDRYIRVAVGFDGSGRRDDPLSPQRRRGEGRDRDPRRAGGRAEPGVTGFASN